MNRTGQTLLTILLFGSIWGGLEAVVTASMGGGEGPISRSVILALIAVLVASYAHFALPRRGVILAIGLVAAGFKFLGLPNLYTCQLAGVIGQAVVLEFTFLIFGSLTRFRTFGTMAVLVFVSGYANAVGFCISQAYIFQNHWWADRGFGGLLEWTVTNGSLAALASVTGFAGAWFLHRSRAFAFSRLTDLRPALFNSTVVAVSAGCWTVGAYLIRR